MLEKIRIKFNNFKEENKKRVEKCILIVRERAEEAERKERERIQSEKDTLMELNEKELMVEAIIVLRGYNNRLKNIENQQNDLMDRVDSLYSNISSIGDSVDELKYK